MIRFVLVVLGLLLFGFGCWCVVCVCVVVVLGFDWCDWCVWMFALIVCAESKHCTHTGTHTFGDDCVCVGVVVI